MTLRTLTSIAAVLLLTACSHDSRPATRTALTTAEVAVSAETAAVRSRNDAADDPAIWRNAAQPAASLIVATDKKAGLYVYGLDGKVRSFVAAGRVNNVDLRDAVAMPGAPGIVVAASDRNDERQAVLQLYRLDSARGSLSALARIPAQRGEAYGTCLWQRASDRALFAFMISKDGSVSQLQLDLSGAVPTAREVRRFALRSQSEGCVVDDRNGLLYIGEEGAGVWRFAADPLADARPTRFVSVDGAQLVADVEGLALAPEGRDGGHLIVSSQGDNAYALYRLRDGAYAGRFRLTANAAGVDGTVETDGIELHPGDFGSDYPEGLFVAQDGDNAPEPQNFKLASWRAIRAALALPPQR